MNNKNETDAQLKMWIDWHEKNKQINALNIDEFTKLFGVFMVERKLFINGKESDFVEKLSLWTVIANGGVIILKQKAVKKMALTLKSLNERVIILEEDVKVLKQDVKVLKQDVKVLKEDVKVLKDDVKVLKADVKVLKEDVNVLKEDVRTLKEDVKVLKDSVQLILEHVSKISNHINSNQ